GNQGWWRLQFVARKRARKSGCWLCLVASILGIGRAEELSRLNGGSWLGGRHGLVSEIGRSKAPFRGGKLRQAAADAATIPGSLEAAVVKTMSFEGVGTGGDGGRRLTNDDRGGQSRSSAAKAGSEKKRGRSVTFRKFDDCSESSGKLSDRSVISVNMGFVCKFG
ncbi:hypothetical protein LINPERPRIM_LOCUS20411, partial [Linum perenne]